MSRLTGEVAAPDETCGVCGLAVGGWAVGTTTGGKRTWDRPSYQAQTPTGGMYTGGGFTHVEGGERCNPTGVA